MLEYSSPSSCVCVYICVCVHACVYIIICVCACGYIIMRVCVCVRERYEINTYVSYRFTTILKLICHLREEHQCNISTNDLEFNDIKDFQSWKAEEEQRTNSEYTRKGAPYNEQKNLVLLLQ